ncbi:MAG: hypothetical protein MUF61_02605 [archaeon]|jgi:hypothetical protein|nr:hypothetical protein [archaeon]
MDSEKYSDLISNLSGIALVAAVGIAVCYGVRSCRNNPRIHEANVNGRVVRYYDIRGEPAVVDIDGKPVIDPSKLEEIAKTKKDDGKR